MAILAPPYRPFSPGFPPLDPARGEGGATIAVTMRYAPLAFVLGLFTPVLEIDGKDVPAGWSRVTTPVAFGEHHVHVHIPYLLPSRIGAAETTVVALPGRTAELEYRAPMLAFLRGRWGRRRRSIRGWCWRWCCSWWRWCWRSAGVSGSSRRAGRNRRWGRSNASRRAGRTRRWGPLGRFVLLRCLPRRRPYFRPGAPFFRPVWRGPGGGRFGEATGERGHREGADGRGDGDLALRCAGRRNG